MSSTNPIDFAEAMQPGTDALSIPVQAEGRPWLDRIGISASVLCAIHCLAAPFLLLLLPAAGSIWSHPAVHWILAVFVVPLALWVLYKGYRKHGNKITLVAASLGALLILAGLISPMVHSDPIVEFSVPAMFGGTASTLPTASTAAATTCTEACCPTITHDATANASIISMPPGGLLTLIGSVLLVLAHSSNLIACRCFAKQTSCGADKACGCPG